MMNWLGSGALTTQEVMMAMLLVSLLPTLALITVTVLTFKIRGDVKDLHIEINAGIQQMLAISRLFAYQRGAESTEEERDRIINQLELRKQEKPL